MFIGEERDVLMVYGMGIELRQGISSILKCVVYGLIYFIELIGVRFMFFFYYQSMDELKFKVFEIFLNL